MSFEDRNPREGLVHKVLRMAFGGSGELEGGSLGTEFEFDPKNCPHQNTRNNKCTDCGLTVHSRVV